MKYFLVLHEVYAGKGDVSPRPHNTSKVVGAESFDELLAHVRELLAGGSDPRRFVTHHKEGTGKVFAGYKSLPREFHGPGLGSGPGLVFASK